MTTKKPAYTVGYKKPPLETRFQKGHKPPPRGLKAPTVHPSHHKQLNQKLARTVLIVRDGKRIREPVMSVFLDQLLNDAIKGDRAARNAILKHLDRMFPVTSADKASANLSEAAMSRFQDKFLELVKVVGRRYANEILDEREKESLPRDKQPNPFAHPNQNKK